MTWGFTTIEIALIGSFITSLSFITGWFVDKILGFSGFGIIGNWIALVLGALIGINVHRYLGFDFRVDQVRAILLIISISFTFFIFLLAARRVVFR